jgi:hypothetical protein
MTERMSMRLGLRPERRNGLLLVGVLFLTGCGRIGESGGGPQSGSTTSPSPTSSYLEDNERWAPPTHDEDGRMVMPVTFPDGTRAELVYPPALGLEGLNVYPDTYVTGGSEACGPPVYATRHDPHGGWFAGDAPLEQHTRTDGMTVQLWEGTPENRPYDFLAYRFGSWTVLVPCMETVDRDHLKIWAENLHGEQSEDGLLTLRGTAPIVMNPWRDQNASTIRMSDDEIIVDLRTERCDDGSVADRGAGDGVVQWCIHPEGDIYLYANGFTPAAEGFLQDLVDDLQVRRVRSPD